MIRVAAWWASRTVLNAVFLLLASLAYVFDVAARVAGYAFDQADIQLLRARAAAQTNQERTRTPK